MRSGSGQRRGSQESGAEKVGNVEGMVPGRLREVADDLRRRTEENPVKTLAMALGAGYLLGGGLFSPLTGRLVGVGLRIGLRVALLPFVTQGLLSLAEGVVSSNANIDEVGSDSGGGGGGVTEPKTGGHSRSGNANQGRQSENKETHS